MMTLSFIMLLLLPLATWASSLTGPHEGFVNSEFEKLGCFPKDPQNANDTFVYMDVTCRTNGEQRCRSGLPFFRLPLHDGQSFLDCQTFCLSKGMDLAGLVAPEMECRCGASRNNTAIWKHEAPRETLMLAYDSKIADESDCSLLVWQYVGELTNGAVPKPLTRVSAKDRFYIDGIVAGEDISYRFIEKPETRIQVQIPELETASLDTNTSHPNLGGLCQDVNQGNPFGQPCSNLKGFCHDARYDFLLSAVCPVTCGICSGGFHPCFPENCGEGGGPWKTKGADGLAVINYYFDSNVDEERRNTFITATQWWSSKVCVRYQESTAPPVLQVGIYNEQSCSAGVGYPGPSGTIKVNMGWCKSQTDVGHLAHELGHALGMNHEQQRPDAGKQDYTPAGWKGPYINIHWDGIDPSWKSQYVPSDINYIGSSQRGYADYDFESVMHYPEDGKNFNTVNPIFDKVVGNRDHLSAGDIKRANDMYQCGGAPTPSPPPTPTPAPPSPTPAGCVDNPYSPQDCAGWKGVGYCSPQSKEYGFMKDHCPKTCGFCGSPAPPPPAPAGCVDQPYSPEKCADWRGAGYCSAQSTEYGFMKDHCPKTCGFCGGSDIVV